MEARTSPTLKLLIIRVLIWSEVFLVAKATALIVCSKCFKKNKNTKKCEVLTQTWFWNSHTQDNILMFMSARPWKSKHICRHGFSRDRHGSVTERLVHHFINSHKVSCSSDVLSDWVLCETVQSASAGLGSTPQWPCRGLVVTVNGVKSGLFPACILKSFVKHNCG